MDRIFDDKRLCVTLLIFWLVIVIIILGDIGLFQTSFMRIGPSTETKFIGITLDTYYKYNFVCVFCFISTAINDLASDSLSPFIMTVICDPKSRFIPYSKRTCITITQLWSFYVNAMGVFSVFLSLSQVDFVIIRCVADLTVNMYTSSVFLRNKTHCCERYRQVVEMHETEHETSKILTVKVDEPKNNSDGVLV